MNPKNDKSVLSREKLAKYAQTHERQIMGLFLNFETLLSKHNELCTVISKHMALLEKSITELEGVTGVKVLTAPKVEKTPEIKEEAPCQKSNE